MDRTSTSRIPAEPFFSREEAGVLVTLIGGLQIMAKDAHQVIKLMDVIRSGDAPGKEECAAISSIIARQMIPGAAIEYFHSALAKIKAVDAEAAPSAEAEAPQGYMERGGE